MSCITYSAKAEGLARSKSCSRDDYGPRSSAPIGSAPNGSAPIGENGDDRKNRFVKADAQTLSRKMLRLGHVHGGAVLSVPLVIPSSIKEARQQFFKLEETKPSGDVRQELPQT
ncbi:hypothetical protein MRX96_013983 [Rhipicephalus microplus]